MNKLSKIGVSALCGSLAAFSAAHAGDLTASGSAALTWISNDDQTTGNPIGMASAVSFTGTGELDNGWGVKLSIAGADAGGFSNTNITITVPGLGDVQVQQGVSGTGIQRLDDITPTVWEEADGAGLSATINKIAGTSAGATIELTPDMTPDGLLVRAAWSKDSDSGAANDKVAGGDSGALGAGWDLTFEATSDLHGMDGLTLYGGISEVDQYQNSGTHNGDVSEDVLGIKYAAGGFTVGYQVTNEDTGRTTTSSYENTSYGVTFSVNDDLSIGYAHTESNESGASKQDPEADSLQIAYTMGGATISIAEVDVENQGYQDGAAYDLSSTVIHLGLAF